MMSETTHDSIKADMEGLSVSKGPISSSSGSDPAEEYKMNNKRRGLAIIFSQKYFDKNVKTRYGTEVDRNNLEKRLKELGFEVKVYDDSTKKEVEKRIKEAAEADHSDADCFLLAFFSHGEKDHIHAMDDEINIQDITAPFKGDKCKSLVGKPKIFILQACRGATYDNPATPACAAEPKEDELMMDAGVVYTLPAGADFIMCYSVAEGYCSFRDKQQGSWYIQDLCKLLGEYGDSIEFTDLLTRVNRKVSTRTTQVHRKFESVSDEAKQVPCFASMLTKQVYFRPKQ